jgi:hypothetical protein
MSFLIAPFRAMLLSFSRVVVLLFTFIQGPLLLFFFVLLPLCYYSLREPVLSPPFPLTCWESLKVNNLTNIFSNKFFFISFVLKKNSSCFLFLKKIKSDLWCRAYFWKTNINPLKNIFYNFVYLCACKCFGSLLIVHRNVL